MRGAGTLLLASALLVASHAVAGPPSADAADGPDWSGMWVTDEGAMDLVQKGGAVTGSYGRGCRVEAKASERKLEGTFSAGQATGTLLFEMQKGDRFFTGKWTNSEGDSGTWRGWKKDEKAESQPTANFSGRWLTSIGTFVLEQKGTDVKGPWRLTGWDTVEGDVKGRRLTGTLVRPQWRGKFWLEQTADGKAVYGLTSESPPAAIRGIRLEGYAKEPRLKAGEVAQGIADNGMLYLVRPPEGWSAGKPVDAIVLLHGSNWTTRGMVPVTARNWPDVGKGYMIVGIQGEDWVPYSEGEDLRFNYTYVDWTGRSTLKGFPYTERESPYLVSQVVAELAKKHRWGRVFVGGHSQGGFLAYVLYMNFPDQFAGAFPVAGGLVIQAEPDVYPDELVKAQKARPLAIVHGRKDDVVPFDTALYIRDRFVGCNYPLVTLFDPAELGHPYDFLPVGDAIRWLDAMTTTKPEVLVACAAEAAKAGRWRDVATLFARAKELKCQGKIEAQAAAWDAEAKKDAARFEGHLGKGEGGEWVDEFFEWKFLYGGAFSASPAMTLYEMKRAAQDAAAEELFKEGLRAGRSGNQDGARSKYEEIVSRCFLSGRYPIVRRWLAGMR